MSGEKPEYASGLYSFASTAAMLAEVVADYHDFELVGTSELAGVTVEAVYRDVSNGRYVRVRIGEATEAEVDALAHGHSYTAGDAVRHRHTDTGDAVRHTHTDDGTEHAHAGGFDPHTHGPDGEPRWYPFTFTR
jgi:hypothetical protein